MSNIRQPHAALAIASRQAKAYKIERLLNLSALPQPIRLLEIGTGSGGIAHYFANHTNLRFEVTSIDVVDSRQVFDFPFQLVNGVQLPFSDQSFDVVLTNHVIEHVGERPQQLIHLQEIKRVLSKTGISYLAVPNRWMLLEPHYRLLFLSWLPVKLRSAYLRLTGRGQWYDCTPLSLSELDQLIIEAQLDSVHLEIPAIKLLCEIEGGSRLTKWMANYIPNAVLAKLRPIIPTLICQLSSKSN